MDRFEFREWCLDSEGKPMRGEQHTECVFETGDHIIRYQDNRWSIGTARRVPLKSATVFHDPDVEAFGDSLRLETEDASMSFMPRTDELQGVDEIFGDLYE